MAKINDEQRKKIIENNRTISRLMTENEEILAEAGLNPPATNFSFHPTSEKQYKIQIPTRYIRTKEHFIRDYGLMKICNFDEAKVSNIAYSLQLSDFNNYIINRIGIYGSILAMVYKQATINIVSIIEVLLKTYIETLRQHCKDCPNNSSCPGRIKAEHIKTTFSEQIRMYRNLKLLNLSDEKYNEISKLYQYRNSIHITKSKENELKEKEHSMEKYNKAINLMKEIDVLMKKEINKFFESGKCDRNMD